MNKLSQDKRSLIIKALIEGMSMRATSRLANVRFKTVAKLLREVGQACLEYQGENIRGIACKKVECDEIHSFVGCREQSKKKAKGDHIGTLYTYTSIEPKSKLVIHWDVGGRDHMSAKGFIMELMDRIEGRVQLNTDGFHSYMSVIQSNFAVGELDHARLIKIYGKDKNGLEVVTSCRKEVGFGTPDLDQLSTSYVERQNLSMRMGMRRFTRRSNGHSKELDYHVWMTALYFQHYNFVRKHQTVKTAPAVAAGLIDKPWTVEDIIRLSDDRVQAGKDTQIEADFEAAFAEAEAA